MTSNQMVLETTVAAGLAADVARVVAAPALQSDNELAECLLAAGVLQLTLPRVAAAVRELAEREERQILGPQRSLIAAVRCQHVLLQHAVALPVRQAFLEYWISDENFRGQDLVSIAPLVGLALEQRELLAPSSRVYVEGWYLRYNRMRSLRTMAWIPYCLAQLGHFENARVAATEVLSARERNGSWGSVTAQTVACAFALSRYLAPDFSQLNPTLRWIEQRYRRGLVDSNLVLGAQTLKLFATTGGLPETARDTFVRLLGQPIARVFISHTHADKPFVRRLAEDLRKHNVEPWVDEAEIRPGESIVAKVSNALDTTDAVAVVLSRTSVESDWVKREVATSLVAMLSERKTQLLPILLEDCTVPVLLRDICWADFRTEYSSGLECFMSAFLESARTRR